MAAVTDADSDDQQSAELLARDGVHPLHAAGTPLDPERMRTLLSSARHELGSSLQSIQGFSELLDSQAFGSLNPEQRDFVRHILTASGELQSAMDACLELAELELVGRACHPQPVELQAALRDALMHAQQRTGVQAGPPVLVAGARVALDDTLFKRAWEALLIALATPRNRSVFVSSAIDGEDATITVTRAARPSPPPLMSLREVAARRSTTRNQLWFRFATALFAAQEVRLGLSEDLDYAELRARLRPEH